MNLSVDFFKAEKRYKNHSYWTKNLLLRLTSSRYVWTVRFVHVYNNI